ncbi:serine/threonine-protein kinase [Streptomyces sp. CBMA29]|uniref:serine/threonine-protein kinase n=1 Tax=Streptomyces sp. CBMA29 TaxID=1896314 RepID=UPI001661E57B|nr:serine/threonine-protein kinase [Streptomyces sp. CBMA29]MBD0736619.1 serine/threonine protein kinase [Streptomyces sp. CBMA29]
MSEVESTDGRVLADRYRLGEVLGKGGMGTVWRAVDETLGRTVAVKELRFPGNVDEDEKQRLVTRTLREAKATARIRNTGAITVFDVVKEDDRPWIVMELVEGRSLSDAIREDGPLTPKRAAEVGLVILDVLKAAHNAGILHRDVKPSNVLLADRGSEPEGRGAGRVVLSDFGIAQIDGDPSVTSTGMLVGAPSYISPERARGQKPGPPADLWSLGALLFASVEGRPPYDKGSAIATLTAVMTEPVGPMTNAGPLAEAIKGLLVKDPAQRLDHDGAYALLSTVAHAPERPVAPPTSDARTVVLKVDPQPTPTDAPPATRAAAADQARLRDALRSVRKAAAAKMPAKPAASAAAPEPGAPVPPPAPPRASLTDVVPRRTMVIVAAAIVIALLGTVIGIALANSGGGDGGNGSAAKPGAKTSASTSASASASASGGSQDSKGGGTDDGKSPSTPSGSASAPTTPATSAPAGFYPFHDTEGFSIALPNGWKRVGDNGYGSGSKFRGSDGRELLVDVTHSPGPSALGAWQHDSKTKGPGIPGYQQIAVVKADYRSYDAADWEYKRDSGGTQVHILSRGFVTDAHHGYAIVFTTPADAWTSDSNTKALATFFATFKPAK